MCSGNKNDSLAFKRTSGPDQSRGVLLQLCQIQCVLKVDFTGQNGCHSDCSSWALPPCIMGSRDKYALQTYPVASLPNRDMWNMAFDSCAFPSTLKQPDSSI